MKRTNPWGALALLLALLIVLVQVPRALASTTGGATNGDSHAANVVAPGETHSNGQVTVANSANSHGNATETPYRGANEDTATTWSTGQQFAGSVSGTKPNTTGTLGSRSGSEATPVSISGNGGTTTMGSDSWAHFSNTGPQTMTVKDVSGNTIASFAAGESGTIHRP